jgi:uncharacterized SAM-binding protein YcdF (DUF218 family)
MLKRTLSFIRASGRLRKILLLAAALLLLRFLLPPLLNSSARLLVRADPLQPADVVMALSGDSRCQREREAAELYRRGMARKIIVSGVEWAWGIHTGEAARRYLLSLEIPEADIFVVNDAWNTRVEATGLVRLMRERGWQSALVVTDPFHSRRALRTFERAAPEFRFSSAPIPPERSLWRAERWWARRGDAWLTVREFISWGNTLAGGLQ